MNWLVSSAPGRSPFDIDGLGRLRFSLFVFVAYWAGAEIAFFIGTLSDKIFAPFWPPNIVLLAALLYAPQRRWQCILAALPAHILSEISVGMPLAQLVVAFVTNCTLAILSAETIKHVLGRPPWFDRFRNAILFVVLVGFLLPAVVALGGAFVPVLGGGSLDRYWEFWLQWCAANVVGSLTLGPIAMILVSDGPRTWPARDHFRQIEAIVLATAIVGTCEFAFHASANLSISGLFPILIYTPVPLLVWSAARFGIKGASFGILLVTTILIWRTLNGEGLFLGGSREHTVFALQLFVVSFAVPTLLLGALIDSGTKNEQKLRNDEDRMELVSAAVDIGFWQFNPNTKSLWASDYCRTMFGIENVEVTPDDFCARVHTDERQLVEMMMVSATSGLDANSAEFRISLPTGQSKWVLGKSHVRRRPDGAFDINGFFRDITALKDSETERELHARELTHLVRVSQVGELSGGLAHELTQPLTAILSNAEAARAMLQAEKPDIAELTNTLDDIIREDTRAGEVIHRLRALLKNGEGHFELIDINELIAATLKLLRSELIARRIKTEIAILNEPTIVSGDPIQLQQVVVNLVMNAIDAVNEVSPYRRHILVKTERVSDTEAEVSVKDNGDGPQWLRPAAGL